MDYFVPEEPDGGVPRAREIHRHGAVFLPLSPAWPSAGVDVELRYDTGEPLAVTMSFCRDGLEWTLGRDLLRAGMAAPAGEGDVRIRPSAHERGLVLFHLESPSGQANFGAFRFELDEFLAHSATLVPFGTEIEWLGIDSVIARVLAGNP
jgi:hypothetical protein